MPALLLGPEQRTALRDLRERAAAAPVDMRGLKNRLDTADGKAAHMRQMTLQTVELPVGYLVTFSIETGHPCGVARHMSMSTQREGRVPLPEALWMVAEELGFVGGLEACGAIWPEPLLGHGIAVNIVQPIDVSDHFGNLSGSA